MLRKGMYDNISAEERSLMINLIIKEMRLHRRMTQQQLAEKIGCTQREVWRYEKPGYKVSPMNLIKISEALDCSIDDLFGYSFMLPVSKAKEELKKLKASDTWI